MAPLKSYLNPSPNIIKRYTFDYLVALFLKLALLTGIKANPLSVLNLVFALIPLALIARGSQLYAIVGSLLLLMVVIIDHVDGAVARYYKEKTYMGAYLERMYHRLLPPAIFFALALNAFNRTGSVLYLYGSAVIIFSMFLGHWARASKYEIVLAKSSKGIKRVDTYLLKKLDKHNLSHRLFDASVTIPCRIDNLCFIAIILSSLDLIPWMVIIYTPYYGAIAAAKVYIEYKAGFREFGLPEEQPIPRKFYDL